MNHCGRFTLAQENKNSGFIRRCWYAFPRWTMEARWKAENIYSTDSFDLWSKLCSLICFQKRRSARIIRTMQTRKDKLAAIARDFDLEIIYAFGSHAEDTLKWLE